MVNQLASPDPGRQVIGNPGDQTYLAGIPVRHAQHDDPRAQLVFQLVKHTAQFLAGDTFKLCGQHSGTGNFVRLAQHVAACSTGQLGLESLKLLFQAAIAFRQRFDPLFNLLRLGFQALTETYQARFLLAEVSQRTFTGNRFDTAHTSRHPLPADDMEATDIPTARDMRAAAQLDGEVIRSNSQYPYIISVLGFEQRCGPLGLALPERHLLDASRGVGQPLLVDQSLHLGQLLCRHRLKMAEIETQSFSRNQRALLLHVITQHQTQCLMHQVRGRVIAYGGRTQSCIDTRLHGRPDCQVAFQQDAMVQMMSALFLSIVDLKTPTLEIKIAGIAHLPTRLPVKRGAIKYHDALLLSGQCRQSVACVIDDGGYRGLIFKPVVTSESRFTFQLQCRTVIRTKLAGGTCSLTLGFQLALKAGLVESDFPFAAYIGRQVIRETIGVVKLEYRLARQHIALKPGQRLLKQTHAMLKSARKLLLLLEQNAFDLPTRFAQFRIGTSHLGIQRCHQLMEERLIGAQLMTMAYRPAHNPAQYIAAALVGGQYPVGNQESAGANVIGNYP